MSSGDDGSLTRFINGDTSGDGIPIVSVSNPVNWGKLAKTIGTSIIATVVVGVTNVVAAATDAWVSIIGGLEAFIGGSTKRVGLRGYPAEVEGLIDVTLGAVGSAFAGAFVSNPDQGDILEMPIELAFNAEQYGVLALPMNVAIALGSVYILSVGFQAAASRLFGGG